MWFNSSSLDICEFFSLYLPKWLAKKREKRSWFAHLDRCSILLIVYDCFTPTFAVVSSTPTAHMEVIMLHSEWNYRENVQISTPSVAT